MIGVKQDILQYLAMVVLASFPGTPGLCQKPVKLLQALKIGLLVEIGVTIMLLAVALDRLSKPFGRCVCLNTGPPAQAGFGATDC